MSNEVTLYTQPQDTAPVDVISHIGKLAMQGPRAVVAYSMAFERLPQAEKDAHIARLKDDRAIRNAEFLEMFVAPPKVITQLVRNTDGTPFTHPITGELVYEDVIVPNPNEPLFQQLRAPLQ